MGVVQRGVFVSSVWLGFMMSDDHIARLAPVASGLLLVFLLYSAIASAFRRRTAASRAAPAAC